MPAVPPAYKPTQDISKDSLKKAVLGANEATARPGGQAEAWGGAGGGCGGRGGAEGWALRRWQAREVLPL